MEYDEHMILKQLLYLASRNEKRLLHFRNKLGQEYGDNADYEKVDRQLAKNQMAMDWLISKGVTL